MVTIRGSALIGSDLTFVQDISIHIDGEGTIVNDLGGNIFTEEITRSVGGTFGEEKSIEEFVELIRDANRIPVQRNTLYNIIKRH